MTMKYTAKITGTGSAFPKTRVTNDDIVKRLKEQGIDTTNDWIKERTGISERRYSKPDNPDEFNSELAAKASMKALEMAGKEPHEIDQIIFATVSPDTLLPSTACWVQAKIGAKNAWAMDINAACSGFLYGLTTAYQFISTGYLKTALVIGSEVLSHYINWNDRSSCILFGDGSGAAIVERVPVDSDSRILSTHLLSDGTLGELLYVPAGGSKMEVTHDIIAENLHKVRMNGKEIFKVAVRTLSEFALLALKENDLTISDVDWFVPHQANIRIIEAVAKRLEVPSEKILINVDRYGNTSGATIPTVLDEGVRDGRIRKGDIVLMDAFGAGLTYGSVLVRW